MLELQNDEELIKKTKPHAASFLSSSLFWIGVFALLFSIYGRVVLIVRVVWVISAIVGFVLIALGYLRRVWAHTYYFTDERIFSHYSFIRKLRREIFIDNIVNVEIEPGIFGKISGYADVWLYGYQKGWVVARMRGVRLGDCHLIKNRAWREQVKALKQASME